MRTVSYLVLLLLGGVDNNARRRMDNLQLLDDGGGVAGHEELLEVVDDHLFAAIGAAGGAHDGSQVLDRLHILQDRLIYPLHVLRVDHLRWSGRDVGSEPRTCVPSFSICDRPAFWGIRSMVHGRSEVALDLVRWGKRLPIRSSSGGRQRVCVEGTRQDKRRRGRERKSTAHTEAEKVNLLCLWRR